MSWLAANLIKLLWGYFEVRVPHKCFLFKTLPLRDCSEPALPWTLLEPRELGVIGHAKYCLVSALPEMVIGLIDMGDSVPSCSVWLSRLKGTSKVLTLNLGSHHAITQDYGTDRDY